MTTTSTTAHRQDSCRKSCAARKNPNAECVCADLDEMGVPDGWTITAWFSAANYDNRRAAEIRSARRR